MFIIKNKTFFLVLTLLAMVASAVSVALYGLHAGIDFSGGSVLEVEYPRGNRPTVEQVQQRISSLNLGSVAVQPIGSTGLLLRTRSITEAERIALTNTLETGVGTTTLVQKNFSSIGPVIGSELRRKSIYALTLVITLILAYITFAFRHVSRPVASWKYAVIAIVALVHDVLVPTGFYAVYGYHTGAEVDVLFVTALLAILGFSVHDTIVVFDRIRENLRHANTKESFSETVGKSLNETVTRSVNTSLTVVLTLSSLYIIGGESTKNFALVLLVGIAAGTYSSVFFASPLLVEVERWQRKK